MFDTIRSARVILAIAAMLSSHDVLQAAPTPKVTVIQWDAEKLIAEAELAERNLKWEQALDLYLRAYTTGAKTEPIRERIRFCLRHVNQTQRHREPAFQQFVLSLSASDALNLYSEALEKLHTHYVDRNRATVDKLFAQSLHELDRALGDPHFRQTQLGNASETKIARFREMIREGWTQKLPMNPREARVVARDVVFTAQTQLSMKNPSALVLELLCGACAGLDDFTSYHAPQDAADLASPIMQLAAYGIYVRIEATGIFVDGIAPLSWAATHSSLAKNQRILSINSKELESGTQRTLVAALRASSATAHEIVAADADEKTETKTRLPLPIPSVFGAEFVNSKEGIAKLRIAFFQNSTPREFDTAVALLKEQGMRALILDLRGNPGGSFMASVDLAKRLLPGGIIATTTGQVAEFSNGLFLSETGMMALDLPVAILVDTRTMSAAEVFASAMKDQGRAMLIGTTTFGKGMIQCPIRLKSLDGDDPRANKSGTLFLTAGSAIRGRGIPIEGSGITPDIEETDAIRQIDIAIVKLAELLGAPMNVMR